jgi:peroxiredoxin
MVHDDVDADALSYSCKIPDVGKARFVFADENDDELGCNAAGAERARALDEVGAQVGGKASSVEYQGGHAVAVRSPPKTDLEGAKPAAAAQLRRMSRFMVWSIVVVSLGIAFFVFEPFFITSPARSGGPSTLAGEAAPVFTLRDDRGNLVSLDGYRGRIVLMNLWASWCPPCRAELPDLQRLANAYARGGVAVVGVNEGESAERARAFADALAIRFPIWVDGSERYGRTYAALGLPTTVILDRRGIVVRGFDGPLTFDQMETAVAPFVRPH